MALHADRRVLPLRMLTDVNNNKWIDFAAISLSEVTANKIYTYYGTMWEIYANEKSK